MTAQEAKDWLEFIKSISLEHLIIISLIIVIVYLFTHPEKIETWKGLIQSLFVWSKKAQKNSISNRLSGSIKSAAKKMPEGERALFPASVKIEWVDEGNETRESFLNGKQVIIRMNRSNDLNKTTAIAAIEMAKTGVLANGKRYMHSDVSRASDFLFARKLVSYINSGQSLGYFDEAYFRPLYESDATFKKYFDQLIEADRNGMYTAVFLNEIRKMANMLFPQPADEKAQEDTLTLLKFLYDLCTRADTASFRFDGHYIKIDVAFTGDSYVLFREGYEFYVKKCYSALCEKINTVYIFALGLKMHDAMGVEEQFHEEHPDFAETKRTEFIHTFSDQRKKRGICIEFCKIADK